MQQGGGADGPGPTGRPFDGLLDAILIVAVIVLVLATAASVAFPGLPVRFASSMLHVVLATLATAVTLGVAALGWVRWRQRAEPVAAFQSAAFLVLAISSGLMVALAVTGREPQARSASVAVGQSPLYVLTAARIGAAALLVVGGLASLRAWRIHRAATIVIGSAAVMVVVPVVIAAGEANLPPLGSTVVVVGATGAATALPAPTPLDALVQILAAALFLWAAALSRRLSRRDGSIADGYLAIGLAFAAFAQIQSVLYPGGYAGMVTGGDLLRLAFALILLLGIQAEASATLAHLRRSNEELARLRVVETEHAAFAERARLSRELHDGLAQDLWLAKLKSGRLASLPELASEAGELLDELKAAIDAGLADAQHVVAALREPGPPGDSGGTLFEVMSRSVDEFADRCGLRVEFDCTPPLPSLPTQAQAEALRIVQEALTNVRRHADATLVRLRAEVVGGRLVVTIGDNGRGFDPGAVGPASYGLASMRERAALIGGELSIDSRPHDGTRVSLRVPFALAPAPVTDSPR